MRGTTGSCPLICCINWGFQSTSPVRGTTPPSDRSPPGSGISIHVPREGDDPCGPVAPGTAPRFQSTSPVRGTTAGRNRFYSVSCISIHVPREGDDYRHGAALLQSGISIHVPREGDDSDIWLVGDYSDKFQSTSPVRGTTTRPLAMYFSGRRFQSTSPVRGTTLGTYRLVCPVQFQSTSPVRGTTLPFGCW